jgi:hypothetical protein
MDLVKMTSYESFLKYNIFKKIKIFKEFEKDMKRAGLNKDTMEKHLKQWLKNKRF